MWKQHKSKSLLNIKSVCRYENEGMEDFYVPLAYILHLLESRGGRSANKFR
jgi:hypothetical protein